MFIKRSRISVFMTKIKRYQFSRTAAFNHIGCCCLTEEMRIYSSLKSRPLCYPADGTLNSRFRQALMIALAGDKQCRLFIVSAIDVLFQMVLRGIGRLDMGLATVGGVGIVILAIILDRLTQAVGRDSRSRGNRRWYTTGPVGLLTRPFIK